MRKLLFSLLVVLLSLINILPPNTATEFSQEYVGVWFDPFVSVDDTELHNSYSVSELVTMVAKISSKFRNILLRAIDHDSHSQPGNDITEIPQAVAKFNKEIRRPGQQPPIQLVMQFRPSVWEGGKGEGSFGLVKRLADEANSIFPNTVETLLVDLDRRIAIYNATLEQMSNLQTGLNLNASSNSNSTYRFGAYLPLCDCGKPISIFFQKLVSDNIFRWAKYLMFYKDADFRAFRGGGMKQALQIFTHSLGVCKERILKVSPETQVGFALTWTYDDDPAKQAASSSSHMSNLVSFWRGMNEWARRTSTSVFLQEAFDNPYKGQARGTGGWWRLVQNPSYTNASQYVYESKEEVATRETEEKAKILSLLIAAAFFLLVFVGLAGAYCCNKAKTRRNGGAGGVLTKQEVLGFFYGEPTTSSRNSSTEGIEGTKYDRSLEIPRKAFEIEEHDILGSGEFGTVFRGKLRIGHAEIKVAVKTTNPVASTPSTPTALKALLAEIKVLTYLGKHENIVGIIGASTEQLLKGMVFVLTEYCALGSLDKFLQKIKIESFGVKHNRITAPGYTSVVPIPEVGNGLMEMTFLPPSEIESFSQNLDKWSQEIVVGMEFLASKHVVHADLATRNVLLTEQKTAKISDFGLSRKLYNNYANYVKTGVEPLPWSWMSPESLTGRVFNEKTDVWSFGITLWEIYSLGELPYAGMSLSAGWLSQLEDGLRLERPKHDVNGRRHGIMMSCWEWDPAARPSFSELKALMLLDPIHCGH